METLEKHSKTQIEARYNTDHPKGYKRLRLAIMAAIVAVVPSLAACSSNYEKCAGSQGKADKEMIEKAVKKCRSRVKRFERRDEGDTEDSLFQEAYDACKIANNKTFGIEARLRAALDTAERKEDGDRSEACRKAIKDVRQKGKEAVDMVTRLEASQ